MQNYPKISIVTLSFNQGQFLEATMSPKSSPIIDLYLKLRRIPKFCYFTNHFVCYRGKRIVRQDKNQEFSHGSWSIQEYSF